MKLTKLYLFILIIGSLLLGSLGLTIKEGLETMKGNYDDEKYDDEKYDDEKYDEKYDESYDEKYDENSENNDYILKSAIVPPVCPKCPQRTSCPRQKACPPCPKPKRCPEPAFECKKVPNYSAVNVNSNLPLPMLNSFSQF